MWTEILITEVTRMHNGRVCIAGLNKNLCSIRPDLRNGIDESFLYHDNKILIRPGAVLKMFLTPIPKLMPPHIEDHHWHDPYHVEFLRTVAPDKWKNVLERTVHPSVEAVFGCEIHAQKNIRAGIEGSRSLGTIRPQEIKWLWHGEHHDREQYRLHFVDHTGVDYHVPINDLNFLYYIKWLQKEKEYPYPKINAILKRRFNESEIWLRLGLTRPFENWCWIQVTGIYTFPDYLDGRWYADLLGTEA